MGLDTFAVLSEKDDGGKYTTAPNEPFAGIELCGGMFSGGSASSSMRGKVYAGVVEQATGESLYTEYLEPSVVADMADRLEVFAKKPFVPDDMIDSKEELDNLVRYFQVCRDNKYGLCGWS
jgi:hypothetical protein